MDILETSTDWARAEMLSNSAFILFGAVFGLSGLAFWHFGKADMARAFAMPTLVAGALLLILGGGLLYGTWKSHAGFAPAFSQDAASFVTSEIERVDRTIAQYRMAVFRVMPLMIAAAALAIIFVNGPGWRAALMTAIIFLGLVMAIDSNAKARLEAYRSQLLLAASPG